MVNELCFHSTLYEMRSEPMNAIWDFCKDCHAILNERKLTDYFKEIEDQRQIMPYGKYKGKSLDDIAKHDPRYLTWLLVQDGCAPWLRELIGLALRNKNGAEQVA